MLQLTPVPEAVEARVTLKEFRPPMRISGRSSQSTPVIPHFPRHWKSGFSSSVLRLGHEFPMEYSGGERHQCRASRNFPSHFGWKRIWRFHLRMEEFFTSLIQIRRGIKNSCQSSWCRTSCSSSALFSWGRIWRFHLCMEEFSICLKYTYT
ncbi:hypothetical protein AVEN_113300-1 [Araneus ventricosus]|uniref:Uncharacterized protein n=1 Tax=Araneus ventricosus TaxID=182803 RepID=A0A4Y2GLT0_ARAVE|nr:hypothetical protein AVEN_113300-1 [Araneus ventricosus]